MPGHHLRSVFCFVFSCDRVHYVAQASLSRVLLLLRLLVLTDCCLCFNSSVTVGVLESAITVASTGQAGTYTGSHRIQEPEVGGP